MSFSPPSLDSIEEDAKFTPPPLDSIEENGKFIPPPLNSLVAESPMTFPTAQNTDELVRQVGSIKPMGTMDRIRINPFVRSLLGPTDMERQAMIEKPVTPKELVDTGFKFMAPPPIVAEPIKTITNPVINMLPDAAAGITEGIRDAALEFPIAGAGLKFTEIAGKIMLRTFEGDFALGLPGQYRAFKQELAAGNTRQAYYIATKAILTGAVLGAGERGAARKPVSEMTPEQRGAVDQAAIDALNPRNAQEAVTSRVPAAVDLQTQRGIRDAADALAQREAAQPAQDTFGRTAVAPVMPTGFPISDAVRAKLEAARQADQAPMPPPVPAPLPVKPIETIKEVKSNAIQIPSTEKISVQSTTENRQAVGERISAPGQVAETGTPKEIVKPGLVEAKPVTQPAPVEAKPVENAPVTPQPAVPIKLPTKSLDQVLQEWGLKDTQTGINEPAQIPQESIELIKGMIEGGLIEKQGNVTAVSLDAMFKAQRGEISREEMKARIKAAKEVPAQASKAQYDFTWQDTLELMKAKRKQAELNPSVAPEPTATKQAAKRPGVERPWDIIDEIQSIGKIRNQKNARPGSEADYDESYKNALSKSAARGVFDKNGMSPDQMADELRRRGMFGQDATVRDMNDLIASHADQRTAIFKGQTPEIKQSKFWKLMDEQTKKKSAQVISVGDLPIGTKFKMKGEEFVVKNINPDTGEVTVDDGRKFGTQDIPDGADISADSGSVKRPELSTEFVPKDQLNAPEVKPFGPKLGQGQNQGDLIDSTQREPLKLVQENVGDAARIAAEKQAAITAATEAKALQEKQQLDMFAEKPPSPVAKAPAKPVVKDSLIPEPTAKTAEQGPGIVGIGGAISAEFKPSGQTATAMKNAAVERDRESMGLPAFEPVMRQEFGPAWDAAKAKIDQKGEGIIDSLISDLKTNPRALKNVEEHALLEYRLVDLKNEFAKATRKLALAYDDGRTADIPEAQVDVARWSDSVHELTDITKKAGTEWGRTGVARKQWVADDFTPLGLEMQVRADRGGAPVTPQERAHFEKVAADYKAKSDAFEAQVQKDKAKITALEVEKAFAEAKAASAPTFDKRILAAAESIVKRLEDAAIPAAQRIRERMKMMSADPFLDPAFIADVAQVAAAKISRLGLTMAKLADEMARDFGEEIRPVIGKVWDQANGLIDKATQKVPDAVKRAVRKKLDASEQQADTIEKIKAKVAKKQTAEITQEAKKLFRAVVDQNPAFSRDEALARTHEILQTVIPDMTKLDAIDAITGRGIYWQAPQDALSIKVRDYSGQLRVVGHQMQILAEREKTLLKPTGYQPDKASDAFRREQKILNELKRRFGVTATSPEAHLASALESRKTYYQNRMADLKYEISKRERIVKTKSPSPTDAELEGLKAEYAKVKTAHDEIFKEGLTNQQRLELAIKNAEKSQQELLGKYERAKKGQFDQPKQAKPLLKSQELDRIKSENDALREEIKFMKDLANPKKTKAEIALQAFITRTTNEIGRTKEKIANGDFSKVTRAPIPMDAAATKLKGELETIKAEWARGREKERLANLKPWQKWLKGFVEWQRALKLSSPVVFGKLGAAAITRFVATGTEEVVGGALGKLPGISKVAEMAPREGGLNVRAMAHGLAEAVTSGIADAKQTWKSGSTLLERAITGKENYDVEWSGMFGRTHGMVKAPVKRAEFTMALEKRIQWAFDHGIDATNPVVLDGLKAQALDDGYRSIFMQHGFFSDWFNQAVRAAEMQKKFQPVGEISARIMRFMLPIVRVPSNIVAETASGVYGLPVASFRTMIHAVKGGLGNLDPVVADSIMRQFKKGSIGLGLMAIGFLNPQSVGGLDWREKRKPGEVKTAGFQVLGVNVPRWMTHAPWFMLVQIGATIRRKKDKMVKGQPQGIEEGMWAAGLGLIEEAPFVGQMLRVDKLFGTQKERDYYLGELAKGTLVPQAANAIASWTDSEKRYPTTTWQHIETGIPGLRQNVPTTKPKSGGSSLIPP